MFDSTHDPDLGYIFYPYKIPGHPGHSRLDVIIPAVPTYRHFDPQKIQIQVISATHSSQRLIIHHPWTMGKSYRVCAGRVLVTDRKNKRIEAFSFGGKLQISSDPDQTICVLVSEAPIFALFTPHELSVWFISEVEILLAEQKAHWDPQHPHSYEMHLATIEPFQLYVACLQALRDKLSHLPESVDELTHNGQRFVRAEIQRLQSDGTWPPQPPTLNQLFA